MKSINSLFLVVTFLVAPMFTTAQTWDSEYGTQGKTWLGYGPSVSSSWQVPQYLRTSDSFYGVFYTTDSLRIVAFNENGQILSGFGNNGSVLTPFDENEGWPQVYNRDQALVVDNTILAWRYSSDNSVDNVYSRFQALLLDPASGAVNSSFGNDGIFSMTFPELDRDSLLGSNTTDAAKINDDYWFTFQVNYSESYLLKVSGNGADATLWSTSGNADGGVIDILGPDYSNERISNLAEWQGALITTVLARDQNNNEVTFLVALNEDLTLNSVAGGSGRVQIPTLLDALGNPQIFPAGFVLNSGMFYSYKANGYFRVNIETGMEDQEWAVNVSSGSVISELIFNPVFDEYGRIYSPGYLVLSSRIDRILGNGAPDLDFGNDGNFTDFASTGIPYLNVLDAIVEGGNLYLLVYGSDAPNSYTNVYTLKYLLGDLHVNKLTSEVMVFPNPSSDEWRVSGNDGGSYLLMDATGRCVQKGWLANGGVIHASHLVGGMYTLILANQGSLRSVRVVKE